jgi:AraC-like DNA-binding protein
MLHATSLDLTTPTRNFWPLLDFARERGIEADRLLLPAGLGEGELRDAEGRVSRAAGDAIRRELLHACPEPALGVAVARHVGPEIFDVLECSARASANVGEVIDVINRFARLADADYHFWLEPMGGRRLWRFNATDHSSSPEDTRSALHVFETEFRIGVLQTAGRRIFGRNIPMHEIWLDWPAPSDPRGASAYAESFDAPVRFDAPFVAIVFLGEALALPVPWHDPTTRKMLEQVAAHRLASLARPRTYSDRTRELIAEECGRGALSLSRIARRLGTTPWTLRRRLGEEGQHFHSLIDATRFEMAKACLLDPDCTITEVAYRLGFRDQSNFFKAFRRWTGQTPAEYRRAVATRG